MHFKLIYIKILEMFENMLFSNVIFIGGAGRAPHPNHSLTPPLQTKSKTIQL